MAVCFVFRVLSVLNLFFVLSVRNLDMRSLVGKVAREESLRKLYFEDPADTLC